MVMNRGIYEAKKLDNHMKEPVVHHITSSMTGIATIRGFQKQDVFILR